MAHPSIAFTLAEGERMRLRLPAASGDADTARLERLGAVLGRDFAANALPIAADREGHRLTGFAGLHEIRNLQADSRTPHESSQMTC